MSQTVRAATSIAALTLLSRILGLVRDSVMLGLLGTGWAMGTFALAWMFPNLLRRLMGEGALASAFIPAFAATLDREGRPAAAKLLASVSGVLLLVLSALTVGVVLLCFTVPPELVGHATETGATATETGALLLRLTAILFPYVILVCLAAIYSGALNSLAVFGWPAALPIVLNVFGISGLVVGNALSPDDPVALTTITAYFLLAGGVAQTAVVAIQLRRRGCLTAPRFPEAGDRARGVFAALGPTVIGMSLLQINTLLDQAFAYYLIDPGANTHIYMANRLLLFPHALTALAVATAVFPRFAVLASRDELTGLRAQLASALQMTLFLAVPAAVGLILIAGDFIDLFFARGEYEPAQAAVTSVTTCCLVAGLPFLSSGQLYTRAIYALGDMRSPARIAMVLVPTNVALNAVLALVLGLGVPGLTLGTALCAVLNTALLRRRFAVLCPGHVDDWKPLARIMLAAAVMGGVVAAVRGCIVATTDLEVGIFALALPMALGGAVYVAVHWVTGSQELRRFVRLSRAR